MTVLQFPRPTEGKRKRHLHPSERNVITTGDGIARLVEPDARVEQLERRLEQALADKARETKRANELAERLTTVKALADEWAQTWARWHEHDRTGRFGIFRVHANRLRRAAGGTTTH